MNMISCDETIVIPVDVATCPDCNTKLTISPDGWSQEDDGTWTCDSFTCWCESEPDIENRAAWKKFENSHQSYRMPYVYWMPIEHKIENWLAENYRFTGLD